MVPTCPGVLDQQRHEIGDVEGRPCGSGAGELCEFEVEVCEAAGLIDIAGEHGFVTVAVQLLREPDRRWLVAATGPGDEKNLAHVIASRIALTRVRMVVSVSRRERSMSRRSSFQV